MHFVFLLESKTKELRICHLFLALLLIILTYPKQLAFDFKYYSEIIFICSKMKLWWMYIPFGFINDNVGASELVHRSCSNDTLYFCVTSILLNFLPMPKDTPWSPSTVWFQTCLWNVSFKLYRKEVNHLQKPHILCLCFLSLQFLSLHQKAFFKRKVHKNPKDEMQMLSFVILRWSCSVVSTKIQTMLGM